MHSKTARSAIGEAGQADRTITLTFDNGPTEAVTPHVLDLLGKYRIRATFFVLGRNLELPETRALIVRAHGEGHWIGNHTFSHQVPLGQNRDPDAAQKEIGSTQALIGEFAHPDLLFRPFGGGGILGPNLLSRTALKYLQDRGFSCVLWNAVPRDWEDPSGWVATALSQCRALAWAVLVLHDYETGAMKSLEAFIVRALDEGFSFRQDFPVDCVPLHRGSLQASMAPFLSDSLSTQKLETP